MERLKTVRVSLGYRQKDVANLLGVDRSTYAKYESGASEPSNDTLLKIANLFGVSVDYLFGVSESPKKNAVPVYGNVAAGIPIEAITDVDDYEEIDEALAASGQFIALRIHGDSMEPKMSDGDVVIVRLQDDCESGDTAVVMINGDSATCKK